MQLCANDHCRLLLAVYPIFLESLPIGISIANTQRKDELESLRILSLNNYITELRCEIRNIGIFFTEEHSRYELSSELWQDALAVLDQVLFLFEDLVLEADPHQAPGVYDRGNELISPFRKLVALQYEASNHGSRTRCLTASYGTGGLYPRAIRTAQLFNRTMQSIYTSAGRITIEQSCQDVWRDSRDDPAFLPQFRRLSEASRWLYRLLEGKICQNAEARHEGYLRLSLFDQPELDMIWSICGHADLWQQVYFHLDDKGTEGVVINCICEELKRSLNQRKHARMCFNETGVFMPHQQKKPFQSPPNRLHNTLGEALWGKRHCQEKNFNSGLKNSKKRCLGVNIATAMLHLFGSPLLHSKLRNARSIYIRQEPEGVDAGLKPYISFFLGSGTNKRVEIALESEDGDPSLLALAAILLELETGNEIVPGNGDIDVLSKKPSMYIAITNHHLQLEGDIDASFYEIIEHCLNLYLESGGAITADKTTQIQIKLSSKVVIPLSERYDILHNSERTTTRRTTNSADPRRGIDFVFSKKERIQKAGHTGKKIAMITEEQHSSDKSAMATKHMLPKSSRSQFLAGMISSSWIWLQKTDQINALLSEIRDANPTEKRVRVAILDTGCDTDEDCITNLGNAEGRLGGHWHDWAGSSQFPVDEDTEKHGTSVVALLLRVCEHAEVFVGRIAKNRESLNSAADNIVQAITYAATVWDVDILTMSFGFAKRINAIENCIAEIIGERKREKRDIIFFAAANNDGLNSREMFPASDPSVISVRGTDHTGAFLQDYNPNPWPQADSKLFFGTLASNVPYNCADSHSLKSGCSIATPILAGITATIVQYIGYVEARDSRLQQGVRTREGIRQILKLFGDPSTNDQRYRYITPWKLFERDEEQMIALVKHALAELQQSS